MAFIADRVLDLGLNVLDTEANRLDITSQESTTYTEATSTHTLGNKTSLSIGSPAARTPDGRRVTVAAITDGAVTGTGTATHWAITDTVNSRLLATGSLSASQTVTDGNTFTIGSFDIGIPGAA
jgi:hypothetical protein